MKVRTLLALLVVVAAAAVCVRLGFWQIERWKEKRAYNAALARALAAPPILMSGPIRENVLGRRITVRGRYDATRHVLLAARTHSGSPGVEVVTPLVLEDGSAAVLVDRGWLHAPDAATASLARHHEPGTVEVTGIAERLREGAGGAPLRALPDSAAILFSARWLDRDTLAARLPYALLPFVIRQLPGPNVPGQPLRRAPEPLSEFTHVSYAVQWFLFASILVVGTLLLSRASRRGARPTAANPPAPLPHQPTL